MYRLELLTEPVALIAWLQIILTILIFLYPSKLIIYRYGILLITILFILLASPLVANLAVGFLEHDVSQDSSCQTIIPNSIIIVLAGGLKAFSDNADDITQLTEASMRRTITGVKLAKATPTSTLLFSGGENQKVCEAELMSSLAVLLGISSDKIIKECESKTTAENADHIAMLLKLNNQSGISRFYIVTSALHMRRALATFKRYGIQACPIMVEPRFIDPSLYEAFIPQISALTKTTDAYHEIGGYFYYWLTDRL